MSGVTPRRDGSGKIDASEFRNVMGNLGERFTIPEGRAHVSALYCAQLYDFCLRGGGAVTHAVQWRR